MLSRKLSLLTAALLVAGCASKADLLKVQREQRELRALVADTQVNTENLRRQLDELRTSLRESGGLRRTGADSELRNRIAQLEGRIASLEAGGAVPTGVAPVLPPGEPVPPAAVPGTPAAAIAMRAEEPMLPRMTDPYRAGLEFYRQGEWDKAVGKFREFVQTAGKSEMADNAQYWIGESYYNQRDFNRAIIELNEVLLRYPQGDRVPAALLALATAFADSGDKIDARLILQKLISDHPGSEEAGIGRQKLQALTE